MTIDDVHAELLRPLAPHDLDEDGALAIMILLHTHQIRLATPLLADRPDVTELAAVTHRHAGDVVAAIWPHRDDRERTNYVHWYLEYNRRTPFESVDDIPGAWQPRVGRWRDLLLTDERIAAINPDP